MKQQIIHIHPEAPPKPAYGAPCNGCGVCCLAEPCPIGILLSRRRVGACVAVRWLPGESRYACGALIQPHETLGWLARLPWVDRWIRRWIAVGVGCDARLAVHPSERAS